MLEKLKRFNTDEWWERGYLIIFGIILAHHFLDTTMFQIPWPPKTGLVLYFLIMVYTLAKLIWKRTDYSRKELIGSAVILFTFIMSAVISDYSFLFEIAFLIVGAKNVSFDKILKLFCAIGTTIMVAAFVASQAGVIENLVYESEKGTRESFGIIYPTDFAAHLFYIIASWICISMKKEKIQRYIGVLLLISSSVFVYIECAAYTSMLCFGILAIFVIIINFFFRENGKRDVLLRISTMSPVIMCMLYMVMVYFYSETNDFWVKINGILSSRLSLGKIGISKYGFSLLGQYIPEIGNGGTVVYNPDYFFLDNSYIRIALEYGVLVLCITLIICVMIANRSIDASRKIMLAVIIVMSIHCFMEQHLLELGYNPFILALFSDLNNQVEARKDSIDLT